MSKDLIARILASAFVASVALTIPACGEDGPDSVDDAVDSATDAVEDAADDAADAVDDAMDG